MTLIIWAKIAVAVLATVLAIHYFVKIRDFPFYISALIAEIMLVSIIIDGITKGMIFLWLPESIVVLIGIVAMAIVADWLRTNAVIQKY